ncbi:MAG: hypothetical protein ACXW1W_04705 [Methylococcaceae bacterium]
MKNQLIIHIGAHKTGTTSIQMDLNERRDALKNKGMYYPNSCFHFHGHHRLAFALKNYGKPRKINNFDLDTELNDLYQELSAIDNNYLIVMSSEEFFTAPLASLYLLKEKFNAFDIRIIAFVRRQDNQFISLYNERIKGVKNNFNHSAQRFLNNPLSLSEELDYATFLEQWALVFGKENICVKQYEHCANVIHSFFEAIGHPENVSDNMPNRKNISVNLEILEILRLVKQTTNDFSIRKKILVDAKKFFANGTPPEKLLTSAERSSILEFFSDSNERLFNNFFAQENQYKSAPISLSEETFVLNQEDIIQFMINYVGEHTPFLLKESANR